MKNYDKLTKAQLIELITKQAQEVTQAQEEKAQAQAQAQEAQKMQEELTGLDSARLKYESDKFDSSIKCEYQFPAYFTQDTVDYRAEHNAYLIELGRRYIQEVVQAGTSAGKQTGKRRNTSAGRKAGTSAVKAQDKTQNESYSYLCAKCRYEIVESDRYITIKKDNKTQARVYVMKESKLKFLIKEDIAKKTGLAYTLMKFNLPASVVVSKAQEIDAVLNAF